MHQSCNEYLASPSFKKKEKKEKKKTQQICEHRLVSNSGYFLRQHKCSFNTESWQTRNVFCTRLYAKHSQIIGPPGEGCRRLSNSTDQTLLLHDKTVRSVTLWIYKSMKWAVKHKTAMTLFTMYMMSYALYKVYTEHTQHHLKLDSLRFNLN